MIPIVAPATATATATVHVYGICMDGRIRSNSSTTHHHSKRTIIISIIMVITIVIIIIAVFSTWCNGEELCDRMEHHPSRE
jgi:uncharacterized membrane protein YidH (DUF202 family)